MSTWELAIGLFAGKYGSALLPKHFTKTLEVAVPDANTSRPSRLFFNQNKGSSHSA